MSESANVDFYAAPPVFVEDIRGTVIIYTELGSKFSKCKKQVVTGYAMLAKETDKRRPSPSSNRDSWGKGYGQSGKGRGLRHYWNVIDENGTRSVVRWDRLRKQRNKGELNLIHPQKDRGNS